MMLRGLYAITASLQAAPGDLAQQVRDALSGGARLIQYRDKSHDIVRRRAEAETLRALCEAAGAPLIINDDVELAAAVSAHGVHLGRDDADVAAARRALGEGALIGVSCYNEFARAEAAGSAGADYVAFGSFFPSPTKPQAVKADASLLVRAARELAVPVVAIGGITPENGRQLIAAGADMLAVVHGVFCQPDVAAAARSYARLFDNEE